MSFLVSEATEYIKKGETLTLTAGDCCIDWSKTGNCITIKPDEKSCLVTGNSTGTATITVKNSKDKTICATYEIIVYEAKINKIAKACDGASRNVTISVTPNSVPITNVSLHITKKDGTTKYNNPAGEGSTITGKDKNWKIPNARWFQGSNECDSTSTYKISGTYDINGEKKEFEPVDFTVSASMGGINDDACIRGEANLIQAFAGMPDFKKSVVTSDKGRYYEGTFTGKMGSLIRKMVATVETSCESNSQYKKMLVDEENYHKKQFEGDVAIIDFSNYFLPSKVLDELPKETLRADSEKKLEDLLINKAQAAADAEYWRSSLEHISVIRCDFERNAKHAVNSTHLAKIKCTYPECD